MDVPDVQVLKNGEVNLGVGHRAFDPCSRD
jgi:hypothetical protein